VRHDTPETIYAELLRRSAERDEPRLVLTFPVELPANTSAEQLEQWLSASGFTRVQAEREEVRPVGARTSAVPGRPKQASAPSGGSEPRAAGSVGMVKVLDVVADRFRIGQVEKGRVVEAIEVALKRGAGRLNVYVMPAGAESSDSELWRFSSGLHCPDSDLRYTDPIPSAFSFNSAVGACEACRGFGRVIGVDYGLVIPNDKLTLRAGAIKPMQTPAWKECQDDLMRHAETAGIPRDTPWNKLTPEQQGWVINGSPNWNGKWNQHWYGVKRFFEYLETKAYKMHIRVLLSKYRSYTPCGTCGGARLKTESLLWRIGSKADADAVMEPAQALHAEGVPGPAPSWRPCRACACIDLMLLPLDRLRRFFESRHDPGAQRRGQRGRNASAEAAVRRNHHPLKYLCDVGIGYLTLDRQSRTLSGGEVQRINLTTALGTSLVNTLFVLDEPSIGLHPRDMHRIIEAMQRLRDAGNTLVVVEHDPAVMLAADRMIDMGPGPGERGGQIVFDGTPGELRSADTLTGAYLGAASRSGWASSAW
jgi:excinuclease ABC subunit A